MIRRILTIAGLLVCVSLTLQAGKPKEKKAQVLEDTLNYYALTGKIIDEITQKPVVFASVYVSGSSIGTVTNTEGEFILKIPKMSDASLVAISYLGYRNKQVEITDLKGDGKTIQLSPLSIPLDEVIIRSIDPKVLLRSAIAQISNNYSEFPEMQTAFYRETIKQNRNYVAISEAVLDIYKSPYKQNFDYDRARIYKGRKSRDVKNMDTLLVKLQGGPRTSLLLDVVKNPGDLLAEEIFDYYEYTLEGMTTINDRDCYVVAFDQNAQTDYPLYEGRYYIDVESHAVTGIDFRFSDKNLERVANVLVRRKPAGVDLEFDNGNYLVNYREINGKWYLNYVRSEIVFKAKWDKKLFKTTVTAMLEMAVTDRVQESVEKIKFRDAAKFTDVLVDEIQFFEDENFWGEYNVIKPDESIQLAIEKLNKKLKRETR